MGLKLGEGNALSALLYKAPDKEPNLRLYTGYDITMGEAIHVMEGFLVIT